MHARAENLLPIILISGHASRFRQFFDERRRSWREIRKTPDKLCNTYRGTANIVIFPGDFGSYVQDGQTPPFHADGILGSFNAATAFDSVRAFVPFSPHDQSGASCRSHSVRVENDRLSRQVRAGLLLLLASCGWIAGGEEGAKLAIARGTAHRNRVPPKQSAPGEHLPIRKLTPNDAPELFAEIDRICWRAKLRVRPQICVLIGQWQMNAYAYGDPEDAVVSFTEGLLCGMSTKEATAIFAHEIAHICNSDSATMLWAAQLQQVINEVSNTGLASTRKFGYAKSQPSLHWLLERAPAIAELLMLALSRFREIEADAFALELTGDAKTLESALAKLEQHHRALRGIPESYVEDQLATYLRSHPVTSDRIEHLRACRCTASLSPNPYQLG